MEIDLAVKRVVTIGALLCWSSGVTAETVFPVDGGHLVNLL